MSDLAQFFASRSEWRTEFSKSFASQWDPTYWATLSSSSGMTYSQGTGTGTVNLGTTIRDEVIFRSLNSFNYCIRAAWMLKMSQRIANQSVFIELVDVIGDGLAVTVNSTTSITVTIPNASCPFNDATAFNGQSVTVGIISGISGAVPGRYAISGVSVGGSTTDVTFTVVGWPASGSGTCSLFGWNFHRLEYNGTVATTVQYDAACNGWSSGNTASTTVSTATSPNGHEGFITQDDAVGVFFDQNPATASGAVTTRAVRNLGIPYPTTPLYFQVRCLNTGTPASGTALNLQRASVASFIPQPVIPEGLRPVNPQQGLPVQLINSVTAVNQQLSNTLVADQASGAITTTTTSSSIAPTNNSQAHQFYVNVTATSGTNQTLDVVVQESDDTGTSWYDVYHFPRIVATGHYSSPMLPFTGNRVRYVQTVGGTSPSFTRSMGRMQIGQSVPLLRQFFDRTIVANTLNSTTGTFFIDGCSTIRVSVLFTAIGVAPALALEVSDDGTTWLQIDTDITPVANAISSNTEVNCLWRFARLRVKTAGTGTNTLSYVMVRGK